MCVLSACIHLQLGKVISREVHCVIVLAACLLVMRKYLVKAAQSMVGLFWCIA